MSTTSLARTQLLVIVGMIGVGKTVVARHVAEHHRFHYLSAGAVARSLVAVPARPTRSVLQDAFAEWLARNGGAAFAAALLQHCGAAARVVLDGLRVPEAYDRLAEQFERPARIISLACDPSLASVRYSRRSRPDLLSTVEDDFPRLIRHSIETGARALVERADYTLVNDASPRVLLAAVDRIVLALEQR